MAECVFTPHERDRIDAIAFDLSGLTREFFSDARGVLSEAEWALLDEYARSCIRRALEVAPLLHAVVDKQTGAIPYAERGRHTFVRLALDAWRASFAPVPEPWRVAVVFEKVEGGEARVMADISALEVIAADRALASLDERCASLLSNE